MQYLYLHRVTQPEKQAVQYIYQFDDHNLSPSNLVIRKLFYCMLDTLQADLTGVEIEYNDAAMVKLVGMEQAVAFLTVMGAREAEQHEYRQEGVLLSRTFTTELTPIRLEYFYSLKDLDIVYRLRFVRNGEERIQIYFTETLRCLLPEGKEEAFLSHLTKQRVPHKVLEENR